MKRVEPTSAHQAFHKDLMQLLGRHAGHLSATEMLAVASQAVGMMLAMQDQRTMTPDEGMKLVGANIEDGNRLMIEQLLDSQGRG